MAIMVALIAVAVILVALALLRGRDMDQIERLEGEVMLLEERLARSERRCRELMVQLDDLYKERERG